MPEMYYPNKIYPFQDSVLEIVESASVDFYLTGGTALGRCYLEHRYSDDLDFFVNDHEHFKEQCNAVVNSIKINWKCDIATVTESFVRIFIEEDKLALKVDFVNDVPAHFGEITSFPLFHRIDSWRNILSNKICALSRLEAKDVADILSIAKRYTFDWEIIIGEARQKDMWVEPLEVCKFLSQFPASMLDTIKWVRQIDLEGLKNEIKTLHDDIFSGSTNSLFPK